MTAVLDVPGADRVAARARDPLQTVWEDDDRSPETRGSGMPIDLERRYGGPLTIPLRSDRPTVMANFVSTIDGIVALGTGELSGGGLISGFHEPDRFVMGLLRAAADAVLVGCGTVNASPKGRWRADTVYPDAAEAFRVLRPEPARVAIVTGRGSVSPEHPVLRDGALVITTKLGADMLAGRLPEEAEIQVVPGYDAVDVTAAVGVLRERGYKRILSEAGPRLFGSLAAENLIDELFLTVSPLLAGRLGAGSQLSLVEGANLLPQARVGAVKILANLSPERSGVIPTIPTSAESGIPGLYASGWFGLFGPKGLPKEVLAKLLMKLVAALADPVVKQRFADLGLDMASRQQQTPEGLAAFHKAEIEKWWPIIKAADIKVQ